MLNYEEERLLNVLKILVLIICLPAVLCTYVVYIIFKKHMKEEKLVPLTGAILTITLMSWLLILRDLLF